MKTPEFNPQKRFASGTALSDDDLFNGIVHGNRSILSRAITLAESSKPAHKSRAGRLIARCLPHSGNSFRLGITGIPGVGKSTFIETFGTRLIAQGHKVAVLAIDPSSGRSKGSILGDKTRMPVLAASDKAFIRPSPSADALGGVARKTRETIVLCEAAGYDYILVETVGVGQSETAVRSMVDFFLLLLLPGAGDELQGIKRGIVEMADLLVINKADGHLKKAAVRAQRDYKNALHLFPPALSGLDVPVLLCSSAEKTGFEAIAAVISDFIKKTKASGYFDRQRCTQNEYWLSESLVDALKTDFFNHPQVIRHIDELRKQVAEGKASPFSAAEKLITLYRNKQ